MPSLTCLIVCCWPSPLPLSHQGHWSRLLYMAVSELQKSEGRSCRPRNHMVTVLSHSRSKQVSRPAQIQVWENRFSSCWEQQACHTAKECAYRDGGICDFKPSAQYSLLELDWLLYCLSSFCTLCYCYGLTCFTFHMSSSFRRLSFFFFFHVGRTW